MCSIPSDDRSQQSKADRFHRPSSSSIEFIQIYDIMGVRVKTADKRWNHLKHEFALTLAPASVVRLVDDSAIDAAMPDVHFDFVPLKDVPKTSNESFIGKTNADSRNTHPDRMNRCDRHCGYVLGRHSIRQSYVESRRQTSRTHPDG